MSDLTILDMNWYGGPHSRGVILVSGQGHYAIIDPGPSRPMHASRITCTRRAIGCAPRAVLAHITFIMDHAGFAVRGVETIRGLAVYVHTLEAPHMIDPSRLLASAARLWPDTLHRLCGETRPVVPGKLCEP